MIILPVAFFTIFAVIFGGRRDTTPKISVIVVDEDHTRASQRLVKGLGEESLSVKTRPAPKRGVEQTEYTAATAEAAVKAGSAPVALIIPRGFGENPISFGGGQQRSTIQLLKDSSDMVAPQMITGLLQKVAITAMPDVMAAQGSKYMDKYAGGFTPEQRKRIEAGLEELRKREGGGNGSPQTHQDSNSGMPISVTARDVVGDVTRSVLRCVHAAQHEPAGPPTGTPVPR